MEGDISIIGEYAFKDCPAIDYVYLSAEEIPQVSENSFCNSVYQTARLFVPANRLQFYKDDAVWGKFENIRTSGFATKYRLELLLSEGGTVGVRQDEEDCGFSGYMPTPHLYLRTILWSYSFHLKFDAVAPENFIEIFCLEKRNLYLCTHRRSSDLTAG